MAVQDTKLKAFIAKEAAWVKSTAIPVRAGLLERAVIRKAACKKLHPNPHDEFCQSEIGPNEQIISGYEQYYRLLKADKSALDFIETEVREPIIVQKIRPDGYMIINGHHRWMAALRSGIRRIPVEIVNLTQEKDLEKMLDHALHEKRVALDLDEVVFSRDGEPSEKPLSFPFGAIYRRRIRLGIPALLSFFAQHEYDIWLYSSGYESMDYVRNLLRLHHARVTGIITGTARKAPKEAQMKKTLDQLFAAKYSMTLHVDRQTLLCVRDREKTFAEVSLPGDQSWVSAVMEAVEHLSEN